MKQMLHQLVFVLLLVATSVSTKQVCYEDLGCFQTDKKFDIKTPLPESPEKINAQFLFYTKKTSKEVKNLVYKDYKNLNSSGFVRTNPTKIIVHGYKEKAAESKWMAELKDAYLENEDFNVVLIDWGGGNRMFYYPQAASNTRVVGAVIARMIMWLEETVSANRADFHCIGHSLGAHVCGFAGEKLTGEKGRLGRITGLDPAEPNFKDMEPKDRLDYTDATFVDIIHTDGESFKFFGGYGLKTPAGHVDFYPNGGKKQPGCELKFKKLVSSVKCDHSRASRLLVATVKNPHLYYRSYECQDYDTFKQGKCLSCADNKCASMGLRANEWKPNGRTNVLMFLETTDQYPFHVNHYNVKIKISSSSQSRYGNLYIKLKESSTLETQKVKLKRHVHIEPGAIYSGLVTTPLNMKSVTAVEVGWKNKKKLTNPFQTKTIKLEEVYAVNEAEQIEWVFPAYNKEIESKRFITLNSQ